MLKKWLGVTCLAVVVSACGGANKDEFDGTIRIAGSTTLVPLVADAASQFMERYHTWDKVDPSLPKKTIMIFVTGGGSGFGVKSALDGTAQVGMSSRPLADDEKQKLGEHAELLLSRDCIAFATNVNNPLGKRESLSRDDVIRIFTGEAKTYHDLDPALPDKPFVVQMRDAAGGSTEILQKQVLKEKTFTPHAIQVPSQGANLRNLETNEATIGYMSSVLALQSPKLHVFKYDGVMPTTENVISGKYLLTRPLFFIVKGKPSVPLSRFVDFIVGEGEKIIAEHGYISIKGG